MPCTNQRFAALKSHEQKKCVFCGSPIVKKNGFKKGFQMYKCHACGRQFQAGARQAPHVLLDEYVHGKQTYAQLGEKYHRSARTIQRHIDKAMPRAAQRGQVVANVVMDTTYFSDIGVMAFKNSLDGTILHIKMVSKETVKEYAKGTEFIQGDGLQRAGNSCGWQTRYLQRLCRYSSAALPVPSGQDCHEIPHEKAQDRGGKGTAGTGATAENLQ